MPSVQELKSDVMDKLSDPAYAMYEKLCGMAQSESFPRYFNDTIREIAINDVSVYSGEQEEFYDEHQDWAIRAEQEFILSPTEYFKNNPDAELDSYKEYVGQYAWELWAMNEIQLYEEEICRYVVLDHLEKQGVKEIPDKNMDNFEAEIPTRFDELEDSLDQITLIAKEPVNPTEWLDLKVKVEGTVLDDVTFDLVQDTDNPELEALEIHTPVGTEIIRGIHIGNAYGTPEHNYCNVDIVINGEYHELGTIDFAVYGRDPRLKDGSLPSNQNDYLAAVGEFMLDYRSEHESLMGRYADKTWHLDYPKAGISTEFNCPNIDELLKWANEEFAEELQGTTLNKWNCNIKQVEYDDPNKYDSPTPVSYKPPAKQQVEPATLTADCGVNQQAHGLAAIKEFSKRNPTKK